MDALQRQVDPLERQALAEELGQPLNWQTMDLDELRVMAQARHARTRGRPRHGGGYPKQPATGTHSTQNFNLIEPRSISTTITAEPG